jgi:hypothetical protein
MRNPIYGISTDPVTSQFFIASTVTGGGARLAFTRIQNFTTIDTLVPFIDWGLIDTPLSNPVWVPWDQAMLYPGGPSGGTTVGWYELLYPKLSAITSPGGIFQPNVCLIM